MQGGGWRASLGVRLRWAFALLAGILIAAFMLLMLFLDAFDDPIASSSPVPLAFSQLPPVPVSAAAVAAAAAAAARSAGAAAAAPPPDLLDWLPQLFLLGSSSGDAVSSPSPAQAPLAMLLVDSLGLIGNDTKLRPQNLSAMPPRHAFTALPLHFQLNSTADVSMFKLSESEIGVFVVYTHLPDADDADYAKAVGARVEVYSRSVPPLLAPLQDIWETPSPRVVSESWRFRSAIPLNGAIDVWTSHVASRRLAVASRASPTTSARTITLLQFSDDWTKVSVHSELLLDAFSAPVSALTLWVDRLCFAQQELPHLFECVRIGSGMERSSCEWPDASLASAASVRTQVLLALPRLASVPLLEERDRLLVVQLRADRDRQKYVSRVYQHDYDPSSNTCEWSLEYQVASKPFAATKTAVFVPEIAPVSNLVVATPLQLIRTVGLSATPFVMTFDTNDFSRKHQSIKIVNLEERLQFTHMAVDESGKMMALADNTNSVVFLQRALSEDAALQWEVILEFSLPQEMKKFSVMCIELVRRSQWANASLPDTDEEDDADPVILLVLLESGVIASFDISKKALSGDVLRGLLVPLDWHIEIFLMIISIFVYRLFVHLTGPMRRNRPDPAQRDNTNAAAAAAAAAPPQAEPPQPRPAPPPQEATRPPP